MTEQQTRTVTKKEANLPTAGLFEADAHQGFDNMDQQDLALPFLRILGQLSPQVNKRDAKYVEGAEPGMIYNTVTSELYDGVKGINVIPCYYKREYVEWTDRGEGTGAPVAVHSASSSIIHEATRDSMNKDRLKNGNYLENTASYFVIISKEKSAETALLTMKSTQLKVSKTWNSLMSGLKLQGSKGLFTPPMFSHVYNLKTVQQSNDKGTWFGWTVSKVGPVQNQGLYEQAKAFAESIKSGEVQAKHSREETKASSNIPEDL
ncbi:MAG: hypothetical protein VW200_01800 [Pelagibacteraceae bacterium]